MKTEERYRLWRNLRESAVLHYERDQEASSWYNLLLAEQLMWAPPRTDKQKRQLKLWQQRGTLERTRANIGNLIDVARAADRYDIVDALALANYHIWSLIELNMKEMKSL